MYQFYNMKWDNQWAETNPFNIRICPTDIHFAAWWCYPDGIDTDVKYGCLQMLDWLVSTLPVGDEWKKYKTLTTGHLASPLPQKIFQVEEIDRVKSEIRQKKKKKKNHNFQKWLFKQKQNAFFPSDVWFCLQDYIVCFFDSWMSFFVAEWRKRWKSKKLRNIIFVSTEVYF
jgi:hypothetical protein